MANASGQMVILDNYAEILIDAIDDGYPDMGINPREQTSFLETPPINPEALLVQNVIFQNGKTFSPILDEIIEFELNTNRLSDFSVKIFDLNGKFIDTAEQTETPLHWIWDGEDRNNNLVPFGIYILCFIVIRLFINLYLFIFFIF